MVHRYAIPYETDEQREAVLDALALHNAERHAHTAEFVRHGADDEYEQLMVGAPLAASDTVALKPGAAFASPHDGPALARAVLVRQAHGRAETCTFMRWHLMRLLPRAFVDGVHAIDLYAYERDDQTHARFDMSTRAPVARQRIKLCWPGAVEFDQEDDELFVPRPARWTTCHAKVCTAVRRTGEAPPWDLRYATKRAGLVVLDRYFAESAREAARVHAATVVAEARERGVTAFR